MNLPFKVGFQRKVVGHPVGFHPDQKVRPVSAFHKGTGLWLDHFPPGIRAVANISQVEEGATHFGLGLSRGSPGSSTFTQIALEKFPVGRLVGKPTDTIQLLVRQVRASLSSQ